ncbi:preprotein translocase subunit SecA [Thermodesulfobacteriota bacterium]
MLNSLIRKIVPSRNEREIKKLQPLVDAINAMEPKIEKFTDDELVARIAEFKEQIKSDSVTLDDIMVETFAIVRESSKRVLKMRHFDVQLLGGIVLHQGKIAEMKTGEGKTLVATLPVVLNALTGKGVHVITVNDYLAKRDAKWMGQLYEFLGLTVGIVVNDIGDAERKAAYRSDITYGTNNEFGFDYLRDNMKYDSENMAQTELNYVIIDEVDSILVDEARTPLIISGMVDRTSHRFDVVAPRIRTLVAKQRQYVNELLKEFTDRSEKDGADEDKLTDLLLKIKYAHPKNKELALILEDFSKKKNMEKRESQYIRDKALDFLKEDLFYSVEKESGHENISVSEKGRELINPPGEDWFFIRENTSLQEKAREIFKDATTENLAESALKFKNNMIADTAEWYRESGFSEVSSGLMAISRNTALSLADKCSEELKVLKAACDKIDKKEQYPANYFVEISEKVTEILSESGTSVSDIRFKLDQLFNEKEKEALDKYQINDNINQMLKAYSLFEKDVDYIVDDKTNKVVIVDEFTGRLMPGRRYSDGLHEAIEEKERVKVQKESQTLATITFQNFFRMYNKLSGMTGTAITEAAEFMNTYNLDVLEIPTNKPLIRKNLPDVIYKTDREKFNAVVDTIAELHKKGVPTLVGTISVEKSEYLAKLLKKRGVPHNVLNAKIHDREAEIVAQAGRKGAVTISTNMAGRGTDILLGGNPEFMAAQKIGAEDEKFQHALEEAKKVCEIDKQFVLDNGGLHIIGTERHESRRIDNQLRGRAGRQGDPGVSKFFVSLEDDLMRMFGSDRITPIMEKLGMEEGQDIESRLISRAIENAQSKVENHNFEMRKRLLDYDDVMNKQRTAIYNFRRDVLTGDNEKVKDMIEERTRELVYESVPEKAQREAWDLKSLRSDVAKTFYLSVDLDSEIEKLDTVDDEALYNIISKRVLDTYDTRRENIGEEKFSFIEKMLLAQSIDSHWKDHLLGIDMLKEGIGLRSYGQKDPLVEYTKEGYLMFEEMGNLVRNEFLEELFKINFIQEDAPKERVIPQKANDKFVLSHEGARTLGSGPAPKKQTTVTVGNKIGRNDPCTCGSGKKYKKCCGK